MPGGLAGRDRVCNRSFHIAIHEGMPDDFAILAEDDFSWEGFHVQGLDHAFSTIAAYPRDTIALEELFALGNGVCAFGGESHEDHVIVTSKLFGDLNQVLGRGAASASPIGPDVDDDHLACESLGAWS